MKNFFNGFDPGIYMRIANLIIASDPTHATVHVADPLHIYCAPFLFVPTNNGNKHVYMYILDLHLLK